MSGKTIFRNVMAILQPGVNSIISDRTTQAHGKLLEKAVKLSLEIIILIFDKDLVVSDYWRPLYQVGSPLLYCYCIVVCLVIDIQLKRKKTVLPPSLNR